ncbi:suppressor of fused domain protein [Desertivirga arenae]|uniref:suppressor of fused domain protein n=1 Tax=Desertivirga arenae TaxID=2810309 RepID=UPI001A95A3DB|nr:suppressor of fused domain protein [Pedobacter sp. SYSU D00823]
MKQQTTSTFRTSLRKHYENYFGIEGIPRLLEKGPKEKLHPDFYVLEFKPNVRHPYWTYCTVGMSLDRLDDHLIELFVFSPQQDEAQVELLTVCASYHRNGSPLNIHHTINIGRPWLRDSKCDHGFISLPYMDGEELEIFELNGQTIHCYWLLPITERERDYKIENGCEALEQLFEDKQLDYLDPFRECLVS